VKCRQQVIRGIQFLLLVSTTNKDSTKPKIGQGSVNVRVDREESGGASSDQLA
jgi:hypothetical protein